MRSVARLVTGLRITSSAKVAALMPEGVLKRALQWI